MSNEGILRNTDLCVENYSYIDSAARTLGLANGGNLTFFIDRNYILRNSVIVIANLAVWTTTQISSDVLVPQVNDGTVHRQLYNLKEGKQDIHYQQLEYLDKRRIVALIIGLMEGVAETDRKNGFLWDIIS